MSKPYTLRPKPKNPYTAPKRLPPKTIRPKHGRCSCCGSALR